MLINKILSKESDQNMRKLLIFLSLLVYINTFSYEELKGIGKRECGFAIKNGVTHPQFATYKMDCETFQHIIGSWYRDKDNVYFYRDFNSMYIGFAVVDSISPKNARAIGESLQFFYMTDGKNIYIQNQFYESGIIENINTSRIKILGGGYIKYKKDIYYLSKKIENPDVKTFKVLDRDNAEDKNSIYNRGKKVLKSDIKILK